MGESEKALREVFRKAKAASPSIIFFDEIDSIAGRRGKESEVGTRVISQLLTELDGLDTLAHVYIIAATNRPDLLDPAIMRPGRIDRILYVGVPDETARSQIFTIHFNKMTISTDVSLDELVSCV